MLQIEFRVSNEYIGKYQFEFKLQSLVEDLLNMVKSISFSTGNINITTETSKPAIMGKISINKSDNNHDNDLKYQPEEIVIQEHIFKLISNKLELKYPEATFEVKYTENPTTMIN